MLRVFALMMKNKVKELKGEKWKSHSLKKTLIPKHAQNKIKKFLSKNKKNVEQSTIYQLHINDGLLLASSSIIICCHYFILMN